MQTINLAVVSVLTSATDLLSAVQVGALQAFGVQWVIVNPSVDIVIVDSSAGGSGFPDSVPGTVANSPAVCPAGMATPIQHRSGPLKAISTSGTATVKISLETQL